MHIDKRETGRNRSNKIRFCSDNYLESIAALIVHSGLHDNDVEFLTGEWCEQLLDFLGIPFSGMELYHKYQARTGGSVEDGKR